MRRRSSVSEAVRRSVSLAESPSGSETVICSADDSVWFHPHRLEQDVRNQLMSEPGLNFSSLVVRRIENGLCLEGVLETSDSRMDVERMVKRIAGVQNVLNCLVVRHSHDIPPKG